MKKIFALISCLAFAVSTPAQEGHFYFSGLLGQLTGEGVKVAPVGTGLPFAIVVADAGAKISPAQFDLRLVSSSIKLQFESLKLGNGHLSGAAKIVNSSGAVVEGVRLDVVSVVEEFQQKDAKGPATRNQAATLASPLFFGDLAKNDSSDAIPFDVSTIKFTPTETTKITINGVVSGLRYAGAYNVKDLENPGEIETDRQGRVYICDVGGSRIVRTNADGGNIETLINLENQCQGVAVDPKSGDIYATTNNSKSVYRFSDAGVAKGSFENDSAPTFLRFDRAGNLFGASSHLFRFANLQPALEIADAAGDDLYTKGFDVDAASGNIWIASGLEKDRSLYRSSADGKIRLKVARGTDWHLGRVDVPQSARVDGQGNVYVAELGEADAKEAARISVFDKTGAFVRVFGRGNRTPDSDKILDGQIYRPTDIAFGANGRIYVACENEAGGYGKNLMLMFEPF